MFVLSIYKCVNSIISSPVEEMYAVDSTTTFTPNEYEEVIDSDDVSVPYDQFGRVILPN